MIGKILILAAVAATQGRRIEVDEQSMVPFDLCPTEGHHLLPHEWDCKKFYYCEYGQRWETPRDCSPGTEFSYALQVCVHPSAANCDLPGVPPESEEVTEAPEPETEATEATRPPRPTTEVPEPETEAPEPETEAPEPETEAPTTRPPRPTTEPPTEAPEPETEAPEPETEAPEPETEAPTTRPPRPTTEPPTEAPEPETEAPEPETEAPAPETEAPEPETEAPTTRPPRPTTEPPTEAPEPETEAPEPETEAPEPETEAPTTRPPRPTTEPPTEAPEPETEAPEPETEAPEPETEAPEPETEAPTTRPPRPTTEAPEPETEAPEPETEAPEPETEAPEPETEAPTTRPPTTTEATTEATEPETEATEAPEQEWLPNGCPADQHEHWLLPHETRCDKFYYCVYGEKVVRNCAPGTHFNPELQVCDWPENVNCANADSSEMDTEGSGDPDIEDDDEELLPNGCPADFDQHKLLPHESDCSKFYYCVLGETVERQCGDGTLFNPEIQVCDWPHNVDCANSGNSNEDNGNSNEDNESNENGNSNEEGNNTEEGNNNSEEDDVLENGCPADFDVHKLLPHESECTKFYYCVHGNKVVRECGPGTHFNPVEQVCDWPENAGCTIGSSVEDSGETTEPNTDASTEAATRPPRPTRPTTVAPAPETEAPEVETEAPEVETEAPEVETEAPEVELLPNGCPADFDVHQLLPHDSDCGKFYYCVHGEKVERECVDGLYFNPAIQVCDWPANVDCSNANSGESNGNSEENTTEDNGSGDNNGGENDNGVLDNGCPADFDVHQLLPHESDCAKFFYCVRGEKVERDCGPGTHFNPVEQVCDWPQNAGCANAGSNENSAEASNENSAEDNGNSEENGSGDNGSGDNDNGVLDNGCPADFNVHQLLPHESECTKFYYCVHGQKVERNCGPGTHFNPVEQVCDWPENAGCAIGSSVEDSGETTEPNTDASTEATTKPPRPTRPTTVAPAPETEAPEVETEAPEVETEAPEVELLPNGCPADFDVHQLLPHDSDCGKFYYCVHGEKVERECVDGLYFNPAIQVCDWPANVDCSNANSGESNGNSEENTTEDNGSGDNNGGENDNGVLDNGCPADFDVHQLLPHESDCAKFFYCVRGEKVERDCGPGTHFNPVEQVCDWPQNAGCANAGSNENSAEASNENSAEDNGNSEENGSGDNGSGDNDNGVLDNGCPADFNVHQLLPHESECTKFYYCVHGQKVERDCGPGTHFNPVEQICDWPHNAGCANSGSGENSGEDNNGSGDNGNSGEGDNGSGDNGDGGEGDNGEDNGSGDSGNSEEATTRPPRPTTEAPEPETEAPEIELLPNGCPADFDVHQLLPHDSDCGKFYYCVHGEKVERHCSGGLYFNPAIQVCDWPANVDCANANSGESNGNSEESGNSGEGNGENGNSGEDGDLLPNGCPADFDVHKLLAHPYYCNKFFYCVNGAKVERECGPGTQFNYELQVCDWPENVNCVSGAGAGSIETSDESKSAEETDPILPNGCPADFDIHQLLPHESECGKFYQCAHGQKVERECAPGTHFNPSLQVCDWPQNAGCENAGSEENDISAEGSGSAEVDNNGEDDNDNGNGEEDNEDGENEGAEDGNSGKASAENGNSGEDGSIVPSEKCQTSCNVPAWAHEHDCDKFWRCDGGNAVLGTCAEGLHFNANTQTCDFICNAGCVREDVQSTPEHDGLKLFLPWNKVDERIRRLYLTGRD